MIRLFLLVAYKAFPFRPHCRPGHHVLACRLFQPLVIDWEKCVPDIP